MATNRLDWMKIGRLVRIHGYHWFGEICDVAETDTGKIMLQINSPKAVWYGHQPEWLEFLNGQIEPATAEEAKRDIDMYLLRLEQAREAVEKLAARWALSGIGE